MSGSAPRFAAAASQEGVRSRKRGQQGRAFFFSSFFLPTSLARKMINDCRFHDMLWWTGWVQFALNHDQVPFNRWQHSVDGWLCRRLSRCEPVLLGAVGLTD